LCSIEESLMSKNIVDTARDAGTLSTLVRIIDSAGLETTLAGDGLFTIFAPSDEAFAALPEGAVDALFAEPATLLEILTYHVTPGRITTAEAGRRRRLLTFQGEELLLSANEVLQVDGARVLDPDVEASNGLIHVIDRVLLPAQI
jgi:uncharacterized surface protein with fasciclin (FAS1) repeats